MATNSKKPDLQYLRKGLTFKEILARNTSEGSWKLDNALKGRGCNR
jgi:hypothetical protein